MSCICTRVFTAAVAVAAVSATARLDPRCVADHDDDDVAQKEKKKKYSLKCRHLKFRTQVALTHTCTFANTYIHTRPACM